MNTPKAKPSKASYVRRRSTADIIDFISAMPGGNVPQYAKLLNTTAIRLSAILKTDEGQKMLVKTGKIRCAEKGLFPKWGIIGVTERGCLVARDVDNMFANGQLPKFVSDLLSKVHEEFRDDTLNFFKEALDQSANKTTFEQQMRRYVEQTAHYTDELVQVSARLEAKSTELDRLEHLLDRSVQITRRAMDTQALTFNNGHAEEAKAADAVVGE